jgi:addiction module HigA family antidote
LITIKATRKTPFSPNYAVPPGAILEDWLNEHTMSKVQLAERMGLPIKSINEIIKGKAVITKETALRLEKVTRIESSFWTEADRIYSINGISNTSMSSSDIRSQHIA